MRQLTCEMCGSTDLVKDGGVFVCQNCGCKYSVEEAKKMMIEGTVEVQGTVKVDESEKIEKLRVLAKRAKEEENASEAKKYYDLVLIEDPDDWEANYYSSYYSLLDGRIIDLEDNLSSFGARAITALKMIIANPSFDSANIDSFFTDTSRIFRQVISYQNAEFNRIQDDITRSIERGEITLFDEGLHHAASTQQSMKNELFASFHLIQKLLFDINDIIKGNDEIYTCKSFADLLGVCDTAFAMEVDDVFVIPLKKTKANKFMEKVLLYFDICDKNGHISCRGATYKALRHIAEDKDENAMFDLKREARELVKKHLSSWEKKQSAREQKRSEAFWNHPDNSNKYERINAELQSCRDKLSQTDAAIKKDEMSGIFSKRESLEKEIEQVKKEMAGKIIGKKKLEQKKSRLETELNNLEKSSEFSNAKSHLKELRVNRFGLSNRIAKLERILDNPTKHMKEISEYQERPL